MARRKTDSLDVGTGMPEELRRHPVTPEQIDWWLEPGEQMPAGWAFGEVWWRMIAADGRWSQARHAWREQNDPTYGWYRHGTA